jgi:hypothetical protein
MAVRAHSGLPANRVPNTNKRAAETACLSRLWAYGVHSGPLCSGGPAVTYRPFDAYRPTDRQKGPDSILIFFALHNQFNLVT